MPIPRLLSFRKARAFLRRSSRALRRYEQINGPYDVIVGFGKVNDCDVYTAEGGVHREYIKTKPHWQLEQRFNPLHRTIIAIEDRLYAPEHPCHIICNSTMTMRQIQQHYGLPDDKFTVVFNGVDCDRFTPRLREEHRVRVRAAHGIAPDRVVLLFVGVNWQRKGLDVLIDALAALRAQRPNVPWTVVVAGSGDPSPYKRQAAALGIDNASLVFAGYQSNIAAYYGAADIAVLPTRYDSGAGVVPEAMACGLPIISSDTNGTAELIEDEYGSVIDGHAMEPEALAAAILRFEDAEARATAGEAGRRRALTIRTIDGARHALEVYARVAEAKRRAVR